MTDQPTDYKPFRRGTHAKLVGPRPVETRPPVGRFVGDLERYKPTRVKSSRARVALRRKTDG